jgi:histone acetyltransferase (RNA polymerase elongator complex component)
MTNPPLIIPIFIPHAGCPRRCVFCNQGVVTGCKPESVSAADIRDQVQAFLKFRNPRRNGRVQIAFFGGNFLGQDPEVSSELLEAAAHLVAEGWVDGIRFSTRPDTVSRRQLEALKPFPVQTVELGVQSMNDQVLRLSQRGHTAEETRTAVRLLQEAGYEVGLQIMIGLPGDDETRLMETGRSVAELSPDFVRIYPTLVLAGSRLAAWYKEGTYQPLAIDEAVRQAMNLLHLFRRHSIPVIRMGLQHSSDLADGRTVLAGPYHPAFGHMVHSASFMAAVLAALHRNAAGLGTELRLTVHPRSVSRMRGLRNANCKQLIQALGIEAVQVIEDPTLAADAIRLPDGRTISAYGQ